MMPGVVDEHVDAPEALPGRLDQAIRRPRAWPRPPAPPARRPPKASSSFTAASSRAASRPETTTEAPSSASRPGDGAGRCRGVPPVTIATRPARAFTRSRGRRPRAPPAPFRGDGRILHRVAARPSSVRLSSPVSTRPGPDLDERRSRPRAPAARRSRSTAPGSPPGAPGTASPRPRSVVSPPSTFRTTGTRGALTVTALELRGEPVGRRLHQRAVEGRAHRQQHALLPAARRRRPRPRAPPPRDGPAMTIWPGELMLATPTTSPCAASAHTSSTTGSSTPEDRGHRAGAHRHRLLHELAAAAHQAHRVREAQRARRRRARSTRRGCGPRRAPGMPARRARRRRPRWR